jgi:hypothetical protein
MSAETKRSMSDAERILRKMRDDTLFEQRAYRGSQFTSYEAARTANAMAEMREREDALSAGVHAIAERPTLLSERDAARAERDHREDIVRAVEDELGCGHDGDPAAAARALRAERDDLLRALDEIEATMCDGTLCGHFTTEEIREVIAAARSRPSSEGGTAT